MQSQRPNYILPLIVLSQFAGTSLWFAGNAVLADISKEIHSNSSLLASVTSFVQFGFISGTFVFALLAFADRFSPSRVFFTCAVLGAMANACMAVLPLTASTVLLCRFLTGFFLAGIYPVGMKVAADWYEKGLGKALGYLVGALVLGTAFPHFLKGATHHFSWQTVIWCTSAVALTGGLLVLLFIPDGPFRKKGQAFNMAAITHIFRSRQFNAAAIGYFGHMWELYTFWAFVPVLLKLHQVYTTTVINVPLWSFIIIATGSIGCVAGGYISQRAGSAKVAFYALLCSGICCCLSPFIIALPGYGFFIFMMVWSVVVIADSPQFSALVAATAPADQKGTALTLITCIGFAITIISIFLINYLFSRYNNNLLFVLLAIGPLIGLKALYRQVRGTK